MERNTLSAMDFESAKADMRYKNETSTDLLLKTVLPANVPWLCGKIRRNDYGSVSAVDFGTYDRRRNPFKRSADDFCLGISDDSMCHTRMGR